MYTNGLSIPFSQSNSQPISQSNSQLTFCSLCHDFFTSFIAISGSPAASNRNIIEGKEIQVTDFVASTKPFITTEDGHVYDPITGITFNDRVVVDVPSDLSRKNGMVQIGDQLSSITISRTTLNPDGTIYKESSSFGEYVLLRTMIQRKPDPSILKDKPENSGASFLVESSMPPAPDWSVSSIGSSISSSNSNNSSIDSQKATAGPPVSQSPISVEETPFHIRLIGAHLPISLGSENVSDYSWKGYRKVVSPITLEGVEIQAGDMVILQNTNNPVICNVIKSGHHSYGAINLRFLYQYEELPSGQCQIHLPKGIKLGLTLEKISGDTFRITDVQTDSDASKLGLFKVGNFISYKDDVITTIVYPPSDGIGDAVFCHPSELTAEALFCPQSNGIVGASSGFIPFFLPRGLSDTHQYYGSH